MNWEIKGRKDGFGDEFENDEEISDFETPADEDREERA